MCQDEAERAILANQSATFVMVEWSMLKEII